MAQKGQKNEETGQKSGASKKKAASGTKDKPQQQSGEKKASKGQEGEGAQGVLRQLLLARNRSKTELGRAPQLPVLPRPTPAQAAATAIGRVAETLYQMALKSDAVALDSASLAELPELLPEGALLIVLQGAGEEMGVIALCRDTVMALIEIQTLSRVTSRPIPQRKLTRADALMCAEFVNTLIAELGQELTPLDGFARIGEFRYATYLDEPRPLALILEDKPFRTMSFQIEMGVKPARKSKIFLALPASIGSEEKSSPPETGAASVVALQDMSAQENTLPRPKETGLGTLAPTVQDVSIDVVGILCRRRVTLRELREMKEGEVLTLPRVSLAGATLELKDGQVIARGKLGEAEGCHALRLRDPEMPVAADSEFPRQAPNIDGQVDALPMPDPMDVALPIDMTAPNEFLLGDGETDFDSNPDEDSAQTVTSGAA